MAVYERLLLSNGGGIINIEQQAEPVRDTATVLIGLGGTGVHCIRTIKTQVYSRLKPDRPDTAIPEYPHIRFLGVDTTAKSRGGALAEKAEDIRHDAASAIMPLSDTEFFNVGNSRAADAFNDWISLGQRHEMKWLEYEKIDLPDLTDGGAGGVRQAGRFMMMDRSSDFIARLEQEINAAKSGLSSNARVMVHVFAGLSGGTGSGTFLDVCYMLRDVASRVGGLTLLGYVFLPDVNLSQIPFSDTGARGYVPKNGYAAMQELDYCMNLPGNGGSFTQEYKGRAISWDRPPVDVCHLVCATNAGHQVIPDAYNYSMNVAAEYVMDFLTDSDEELGLVEHIANYRAKVHEADERKTIGSNMGYCVIGAASAHIPLKEINTYLASELYAKFSHSLNRTPSEQDVKDFAVTSLAEGACQFEGLFEHLWREVNKGADGPFENPGWGWKEVRDMGTKGLVHHYTDQRAQREGTVTHNAEGMADANNERSLIGRVDRLARRLSEDLSYGPAFADQALAGAGKNNLLNVIDGLIAECESRLSQAVYDHDNPGGGVRGAYERADREFLSCNALNGKKRYGELVWAIERLLQNELEQFAYRSLGEALEKLRGQVLSLEASRYAKLARVERNLEETFGENRSALASEGSVLNSVPGFSRPMMTMAELKGPLDRQVATVSPGTEFSRLMGEFLSREREWVGEDESHIARIVIDFFADGPFGEFASRGITEFLRDRYEATGGAPLDDDELAGRIYSDWMRRLVADAAPLFCFNGTIWGDGDTAKISHLSYPRVSAPIKAAAAMQNAADDNWKLRDSSLTDRIFAMSTACGLPMASYAMGSEYEVDCYSSVAHGRHYYEAKSATSKQGEQHANAAGDWTKLPSVTPLSRINPERVPHDLKESSQATISLFDRAWDSGVIDVEGVVSLVDSNASKSYGDLLDNCKKALDTAIDINAVAELEAMLASLESMKLTLVPSSIQLPRDGNRAHGEGDIKKIMLDHFAYSPRIQAQVEESVALVESMGEEVESMKDQLKSKIALFHSSGADKDTYFNALFSGVLDYEGKRIVYRPGKRSKALDEIVLSDFAAEFPFKAIPPYQGFVNFQDVDAEIKEEIAEIANQRVASASPEVATAIVALKDEFTEKKMDAWRTQARKSESNAEIVKFLNDLDDEFESFCALNE